MLWSRLGAADSAQHRSRYSWTEHCPAGTHPDHMECTQYPEMQRLLHRQSADISPHHRSCNCDRDRFDSFAAVRARSYLRTTRPDCRLRRCTSLDPHCAILACKAHSVRRDLHCMAPSDTCQVGMWSKQYTDRCCHLCHALDSILGCTSVLGCRSMRCTCLCRSNATQQCTMGTLCLSHSYTSPLQTFRVNSKSTASTYLLHFPSACGSSSLGGQKHKRSRGCC